ncbi:hypothetical protein [Nostoc sp. 'Peltigera membranacea cyanobiont' 232]|uniref:hypothetical protein n=1 Tax=Nostoc sp. 'Peltigera membranacea cyanobiont' 232 TaxID=2014531 RepID=UPI000B95B569|nr:hypothetical protein [Nostoc sp. 'Peltigera membranacea cyanobiont' 232]OYE02788.1 hypothetical protein CDG79_21930 [Nostoc sp. 'Peltigera membranacea cyanobiont' 232]
MDSQKLTSTLKVCLSQLMVVNNSSEFKKIEASRYFSTTNDVFLGDAINTINEVLDGIEEVEACQGQRSIY